MEREWRKFGNLGLASCLQELIAPPQYHDALRAILGSLRARGRYLIGDVEFTSIPDQS